MTGGRALSDGCANGGGCDQQDESNISHKMQIVSGGEAKDAHEVQGAEGWEPFR